MTDAEWKELEREGEDTERGKELLEQTSNEDEHPEWFNGPCFCRMCIINGY